MGITSTIDRLEAMIIADSVLDQARAMEYDNLINKLRKDSTVLAQENALYYGSLMALNDFHELHIAARNLVTDTLSKASEMESTLDD